MATRPVTDDCAGARDTPPGGDVDPPSEVVEAAGVAMTEAGATAAIYARHGDFL